MGVQTPDISFFDKPKLELTNYTTIISMYIVALFNLVMGLFVPSQSTLFIFIAFLILIIIAPIHYFWINTEYELNNSQIRIQSGFYQKRIELTSIIKIKVDRRYSPLAIHPPAVKYRDRVWLMGKFGSIMITPDNPIIFIKELKKRVPRLEVED